MFYQIRQKPVQVVLDFEGKQYLAEVPRASQRGTILRELTQLDKDVLLILESGKYAEQLFHENRARYEAAQSFIKVGGEVVAKH